MRPRVLVIDDEPLIRQLLNYVLTGGGYLYDGAADTREADRKIEENRPDLILLDWSLPGVSGMDWLRRKADRGAREPPVIFLTARDGEQDKVAGLRGGGDDYITKPFSNEELLARIESVLRRRPPAAGGAPLRFGAVTIDPGAHKAAIAGEDLDLNRKEFQLLTFFATHPGRVYDRQSILNHVWGQERHVNDRNVDVHVRRLRQRLERLGERGLIKTVWGIGYMAVAKAD